MLNSIFAIYVHMYEKSSQLIYFLCITYKMYVQCAYCAAVFALLWYGQSYEGGRKLTLQKL